MKNDMALTFSDWIAITSLISTVGGMTWIGVFQYSKLIHEVKSLGGRVDKLEDRMERGFEKIESRFEKLETRMDNFQAEMHKFNVRLTIVEQRKAEP
jgi:hypothetical protein